MLDLCKGCKCNAVCNLQTQLIELAELQDCKMSEELAEAVDYKIIYTCKYRIREREGKKGE